MATASPPRLDAPFRDSGGVGLPPLTDEDVDPLLLQLGALIGLLIDQGDGSYAIDAQWFEDPWTSIQQIPAKRAGELFALLETLMGTLAPGAIGQPHTADGLQWYPLLIPGLADATGASPLYVVGPAPGAQEPVVLGLGARYALEAGGVAFTAYAHLPLLQLGGNTSAQLVLGTGLPATPAQVGIQVSGVDLAAGDVACGGLQFRCSVPLSGGTPQLELVFLQLQLPGQKTATDQTLEDVLALGAGEWIATALSVLANGLGTLAPAYKSTIDQVVAALLGLLGITPGVPGPDWEQLFEDPASALLHWVGALAATDATLKQELEYVAELLEPTTSAPPVGGSGTRTDPFSVAVLSAGPVRLAMTVATEVDQDGSRHVFPGVTAGVVQAGPGTLSAIAVEVAATAELADLVVPAPSVQRSGLAAVHVPLASLGFVATLRSATAGEPLFSLPDPTTANATFSVGSGVAGLRFDGATQQLLPVFELLQVTSGVGSWPVIDFSSVDATVNQLKGVLSQVVEHALTGYFGAQPTGPAAGLAAVLGLIAPSTGWTVPLLLDDDGIDAVLADPLGALGAYYRRVLVAQGGTPAPMAALLGSLAILMGEPTPAPQGSGTMVDPWTALLVDLGGGLTARLTAWSPAAGTLHVGIEAAFALDLNGATVTTDVELAIVDVQLPAGGQPGADWLPGVSVGVLTAGANGPLTVPSVAGVSLAVERAGVTAGWLRGGGDWYAVVEIDGATLTGAGGITVALDLPVFAVDPAAWTAAEFAQLADAALALIGLWLLEHGGRAGVALTTVLGLLPDLPAVFSAPGDTPFPLPSGFTLPAAWPALTVTDPGTFFTAPWRDLQTQLAAVLATPATGQAAATLFGWALTGAVNTPAVTPAGTHDDPFTATLTTKRPAALLAWTVPPASGTGVAGAGLGAELTLSTELLSAAAMRTVVRVDVLTVELAAAVPAAPALELVAAFTGLNGAPLLHDAQTGVQIGSAEVGVTVTAGGIVPVVTFFDATPGDGVALGTVDFASALGSSLALQRLGSLVGALFALLSTQSPAPRNGGSDPLLTALLDVLDALDLTGPAQGGGTGVVSSSWTALLADPGQYATGRLGAIFAGAPATQAFLGDVAALLGLELDPRDGTRCLLAVATALGLGVSTAEGPLPSPSALLALLADPLGALRERARALFGDAAAVKAFVTALSEFPNATPLPLAPGVTVSVANASSVTVAVAGIALGGELRLSGTLTLDVTSTAVTGAAQLSSPPAGVAVALSGGVRAGVSGWDVALTVPDQLTPAPFAPVPLAGSAGGIDPAVISVAVPTFVISSVATALLNGFVLPSSPLASRLAVALGLAPPPAAGAPARVASLAGAFMHPAEWLDGAFGDGAQVDLATLGQRLAGLAAGGVDGPGGIVLAPVGAIGVQVTGLPYGTSLAVSATSDGLTLTATLGETLAGIAVALSPTLSYAPPAGVTVGGSTKLTGTIAGQPLTIAASYAGAFGLTATVASTALTLYPFGGLNQYAAGASEVLLEFAVQEALSAYQAATVSADVKALVTALGDIATAAGITSVADLVTAATAIVNDPLAWLGGLVAGAAPLAAAIATLLATPLGVSGISAAGGLVVFSPALSAGSVAAKLGFNTNGQLGIWLDAGLTVVPLAFDVSTGAALTVPVAQTPAFDLSAGATLALTGIADMPVSPSLTGAIDFTGGTPTGSLQLFPCGQPKSTAELPAIELLPAFRLTTVAAPAAAIPLTRWLEDLTFAGAIPVLGAVVLAVPAVSAWFLSPLNKTTLAGIAADLGVLTSATAPLLPADLRVAFGSLTAEEAVAKVAGTALAALAGLDLLPASLKPATITLTATPGTGGATLYGLQATIPGIVVSGADGRSPKVVVQLGAWPTGDDTAPHWISRSLSTAPDAEAPGIDITLVSASGTTMTFAPTLALVSLGVDVSGAGTAPLLDVAGCTLGGIEARTYVSGDAGSWHAGALLRIDDLALPLGPQLGAGTGSTNPIASDLLSSDTGGGGAAAGPSVNPAFSAQVSVVEPGGTFDFQFLGDQPGDTPTHLVIPIQRGLGPLYCRQVELDWTANGPLLGVGFDGSVALAGLSLTVQGLEVTIPVTDPLARSEYDLDLSGLEVAFGGGGVTIDGGLLETTSGTNPAYTGGLSVQAEQFGLTVLGSYTVIAIGGHDEPSLFAFGLLDAPIGGPPFFFVTAIAAGFGYNRELRLPGQDDVATFPLVAGVRDPSLYFKDWQSKPGDALSALDAWIPPKAGEYWLAAGVQFTTFELLQSYALLAIEFGTELVIALLGTSTLAVPSAGGQAIEPIAQATLELEAVFKPSSGTFSLTAVLTPDSYVLSPDAHLTGGFAFEIWWAGEHAGQFVLTIGGYSPRFEVPSYYPQEQRLGLRWSLGPVQITGGAYFALTPSAVMAGGELSLVYELGALKAWLDASADILVRWKPFSFVVDIAISIGASYRVDFWFIHHTFTIELGASLELHGMPVGGKATIHWYVISFTIGFGHNGVPALPLAWSDFASSFLPTGPVVGAAVTAGLVKTLDGSDAAWLVGQRFTLATNSLIPSTQVAFNADVQHGAAALGVRPMQVSSLASSHTVTLHDAQGNAPVLTHVAVTGNVPAALWSPEPELDATPSNELVANALTGIVITAASKPVVSLDPIPLSRLFETSIGTAAWAQPKPPAGIPYSRSNVVAQLEAALTSATVTAARDALVAGLQATCPELTAEPPAVLARFADQVLQAPPLLVTLGAEPTAETGAIA